MDASSWNQVSESALENEEHLRVGSNRDDFAINSATVQSSDILSSSSSTSMPSCKHSFQFQEKQAPTSVNDVSEVKIFRVKRKFSSQEVKIVKFHRNEIKSILEKLSTKFGMNKRKIYLEYALEETSGKEEIVTVDSADEDGLENFFIMAGNMDLITVGEKISTNKREKKHCKEASDRIQSSSKESINTAYYLKLVDNPEVADTYVKKQKFVQYLLGVKEGCNMLNPHTVLCHVPGCMGLIKLKAANNISSIVEHWKIHSNPTKSLYHESYIVLYKCCIVLRRLEFLKCQSQNYWKDMNISLDELEHEHNHLGQSLAIQALMDKCFIAHQGKKFRGSSLMADLGIMQGIAEGDPDVLSRLPPAKSIETYFNRDKS